MEWFLTDVERLGGRQVNKMCGSIFCHRISEVGFGVGNIVYQVFNVLVIPGQAVTLQFLTIFKSPRSLQVISFQFSFQSVDSFASMQDLFLSV